MSKILAVGDIHTKLWIIEAVEKILDNYDTVVFVGDYADDWGKGPVHTLSTWARLKELQDNNLDKVKLVLGNHDYIYLNYTKTTSGGYNKITQTLIDMPENRELRDWLCGLPITVEVDNVLYSHAGLSESFNDDYTSRWLWEDNSPIWTRPGYEKYRNMPQVFGHTPSKTCWEVQPNIWCIDTHSTFPNGANIGDNSLLEIVDGKKFNKIKLG